MIKLIAHRVEMSAQIAQIVDHPGTCVRLSRERNLAVIRVPVNAARAFSFDLALERMSRVKEETLGNFVVHAQLSDADDFMRLY